MILTIKKVLANESYKTYSYKNHGTIKVQITLIKPINTLVSMFAVINSIFLKKISILLILQVYISTPP